MTIFPIFLKLQWLTTVFLGQHKNAQYRWILFLWLLFSFEASNFCKAPSSVKTGDTERLNISIVLRVKYLIVPCCTYRAKLDRGTSRLAGQAGDVILEQTQATFDWSGMLSGSIYSTLGWGSKDLRPKMLPQQLFAASLSPSTPHAGLSTQARGWGGCYLKWSPPSVSFITTDWSDIRASSHLDKQQKRWRDWDR